MEGTTTGFGSVENTYIHDDDMLTTLALRCSLVTSLHISQGSSGRTSTNLSIWSLLAHATSSFVNNATQVSLLMQRHSSVAVNATPASPAVAYRAAVNVYEVSGLAAVTVATIHTLPVVQYMRDN
jgi:hypothetical protein